MNSCNPGVIKDFDCVRIAIGSVTWVGGLAFERNPVMIRVARFNVGNQAATDCNLSKKIKIRSQQTKLEIKLASQSNVLKNTHCRGTEFSKNPFMQLIIVHWSCTPTYSYTVLLCDFYATVDIVAVDAVFLANESWQNLQVKENQI